MAKLGPVGSDCPKVFRLLSVSVQFAWSCYLELYVDISQVSVCFVGHFPPNHVSEVDHEGAKLTSFLDENKFCDKILPFHDPAFGRAFSEHSDVFMPILSFHCERFLAEHVVRFFVV